MPFFRKTLDSDAFGYQLGLLSRSAVSETDKALANGLSRSSVLNGISVLQFAGIRFNEVLNEREFTTIFGVALTALLGLSQTVRISERMNAGMDRLLVKEFDNAEEVADYRTKLRVILLQQDNDPAATQNVAREVAALAVSDSLLGEEELPPEGRDAMLTFVASSFEQLHSIAAGTLRKAKLS